MKKQTIAINSVNNKIINAKGILNYYAYHRMVEQHYPGGSLFANERELKVAVKYMIENGKTNIT